MVSSYLNAAAATLWIASLVSSTAAAAAADLSVTVYEGPKECDEANTVKAGDYLSMHYTGKIDETSATGTKGEKFDSSLDRGQTFDFKIGTNQVIPGWDQGLLGLCMGAKVCTFQTLLLCFLRLF